MRKLPKKILATMMSLIMVAPSAGVLSSVSVSAEVLSDTASIKTTTLGATNNTIGTYNIENVASTLLVHHTGESNQLPQSDIVDTIEKAQENYDENFISLSCDSQFYDDLGYNSNELKSNAKKLATDEQYQNIISDVTCVNPNELIVGSVNKNGGHKVLVKTYDNSSASDASYLSDGVTMRTNTDDISFEEDHDYQTHNAIAIDINNDGIDELAYASLFYDNDNGSKADGSSFQVELKKRVSESNKYYWNNVAEKTVYMDSDNYVLDIEAQEALGYIPLAVGDYDNDDCEELACYLPDRSSKKQCEDARICIIDFKESNGTVSVEIPFEIKLSQLGGNSNYVNMVDNWRMPTVALSTASIRLGEKTNTNSGAAHYNTYDDLVISVSVPRQFKSKGYDIDSQTYIYSFDNGSAKQLFSYKHSPSNSKRMNYVNTCEADLNGDGFDEIVVAGLKENTSSSTSYGSFDNNHNLVNIISYEGDNYQMLWSEPKEVKAPGNLTPDKYNSIEPIAMCAGNYSYEAYGYQDQLCIQGIVLSCEGVKVSGTPVYVEGKNGATPTSEEDAIYVITDTVYGYDVKNFENATFKELYTYSVSNVGASGTCWVNQCISGDFLDSENVEQIVIVTSDPNDDDQDEIYMDYSIISQHLTNTTSRTEWKYTAFNDYLNAKDEDDDGTCMFLCFIDCEYDTYYYRYAGAYSSYSSPILYSIVMAPPYYKESNSVSTSSFSISSGVSNYSAFNFSLGFRLGVECMANIGLPFIAASSTLVGGNIGLDGAYNHTWTSAKNVTQTITLKTNDDYAICYVVPIIVNNYEIYKTKDLSDTPEIYQITETLSPEFTALTIDKYNEAVKRSSDLYEAKSLSTKPEDNTELPPELNSPYIDKEKLPSSCPGDIEQYEHNLSAITDTSSVKDYADSNTGTGMAQVRNDAGVSNKSVSISFTDSYDNKGTFTLGGSFYAKQGWKFGDDNLGGTVYGTLNINGSIGGTFGRNNSDGISFSTGYNMPARSYIDGVQIAYGQDKYDIENNNKIVHYDLANGTMYNYDAVSVCYPVKEMDVSRDEVQSYMDPNTNVRMDANNDVVAIGYYTQNYEYPPEPPAEFALKSLKYNGSETADVDDDTVSISLLWNSKNRNAERKTDGYNLYMIDANKNSNQVYLVNKEGLIKPSEDSDYTTYSVKLRADDCRDNTTFYIAPVYCTTDSSGKLVYTEGTLSAKVEIPSISQNESGKLRIVSQPENYIMSLEDTKEDASYSITVENTTTDTSNISFTWQQYNKTTGVWENVYNEIKKQSLDDNKSSSSTYSTTISGNEKDSMKDIGIRCVVNIGTYSVTSDIASAKFCDCVKISSYKELVNYRDGFNKNYERYKYANVELNDNIIAPEGSEWTQGIGDKTSEKPFIATFDGKGYCISGVSINNAERGALFDYIGTNGVVKNLAVIGINFKTVPKLGADVAVTNEGTIDHCTSGVLSDNKSINLEEGKTFDLSKYHSTIKGKCVGGITSENNGLIIGCRNSADVEGEISGGIAGNNSGTIYGCANNGSVGTSTSTCIISGGIAGKNSFTISCSYNSGKINCSKNDSIGEIVGQNSSLNVKNCFFNKGFNAIGSASTLSVDSSNKDVISEEMDKNSFIETLNNVTDDRVEWVTTNYGNTSYNNGYPIIKSNYLQSKVISLIDGISISGMMHSDLQINLSKLSSNNSKYKSLTSKGNVIGAYSAITTDKNGMYIPSELWNAYGYEINIPTNGKDIRLSIINSNGDAVTVNPTSVSNNIATFRVADLNSFAVLENKTTLDNEATSNNGTTPSNGAVYTTSGVIQTGQSFFAVLLVIVLLAGCALVILWRKAER